MDRKTEFTFKDLSDKYFSVLFDVCIYLGTTLSCVLFISCLTVDHLLI